MGQLSKSNANISMLLDHLVASSDDLGVCWSEGKLAKVQRVRGSCIKIMVTSVQFSPLQYICLLLMKLALKREVERRLCFVTVSVVYIKMDTISDCHLPHQGMQVEVKMAGRHKKNPIPNEHRSHFTSRITDAIQH